MFYISFSLHQKKEAYQHPASFFQSCILISIYINLPTELIRQDNANDDVMLNSSFLVFLDETNVNHSIQTTKNIT